MRLESKQKQQSVRVKQVAFLFNQARTETIGGVLSAAVVAAWYWKTVEASPIIGWTGSVLVVYLVRLLLTQISTRSASATSAPLPWLAAFMVGLAVSGCLWGVAGAAVVFQSSIDQSFALLFWLACMTFAVSSLYSGLLSPLAAFATPALGPAIFFLVTQSDRTSVVAGVMLCIFWAVLIVSASWLRKSFAAALKLEQEKDELLADLHKGKDEIAKLNVAVKTQLDKCEEAESELRRASADLGFFKSKVKGLSELVKRVSERCPITGLANRQCFDRSLDAEWRRAMRDKKPLSLILLNLDDFEFYKALSSSQASNACLKRVAKLIESFARRPGDTASRYYGTTAAHCEGSKFALLLPGCDTKNAVGIAEHLRRRIEDLRIAHEKSAVSEVVTAHLAVATVIPNRHTTQNVIMERIDNALYEARFQGGNRVVCYRALEKLRMECWDNKSDGPLTEEGLEHKLLTWGFVSNQNVYQPHERLPDENHDGEMIYAVLRGQMCITVEGQSFILKKGNCLFVPPRSTCSFEVAGQEPVVCLSGFHHSKAA
jgi:diguanylate cyclase (GGDEF)-like protein